MAVLSSGVEFALQAAENLSEGGVVRLLMTALQQLECLLMTTFPRTERLLMTILCSACQCFFLLCLFQLRFWANLLYYTSMSLSDSGLIFVFCQSMLPNQTKFVKVVTTVRRCSYINVTFATCVFRNCYM